MKLDQINKERNFSKRVLADFSAALPELLQSKRLEEITIGELCSRCSYPRSTFYNYFEDIYALMDCCWERLAGEIRLDHFQEIPHEERTRTLFNLAWDYMESRRKGIRALAKHNPEDGAMMQSLIRYVGRLIRKMVEECPASDKYPIPLNIAATHYSNTVCMLLQKGFLTAEPISKEDALGCLDYLLGTLEREGGNV